PKYLHADTDEKKGGEPQNNAHSALTDESSEPVCKSVANENADAHQSRANYGGEDRQQVRAQMMGLVSAERDGHGDRPGTYGQGKRQRVESTAKNITQVHFFLDILSAVYL